VTVAGKYLKTIYLDCFKVFDSGKKGTIKIYIVTSKIYRVYNQDVSVFQTSL
jgi:hypothetical protein